MENFSTITTDAADWQGQLNDLLNDRMFIILFVIGQGTEQSTIYDRAGKMFANTPNEYTVWLTEPNADLLQYLQGNVHDFDKIAGSINNVVAFSVSMVGNRLVHVINSGEWNSTDKVRIFQAYNACINVV